MDLASIFILVVYGGGFVVILGILVYLIFRRTKIKESEDFEDRDN